MNAALDLLGRVPSILVFLTALTIVSECCSVTGLFDVTADAIVVRAHGSIRGIWALFIAMACLVTAFLSLDTTAVLLTTAGVALARRVDRSVVLFAFPTLWIANMASMWLPVSNLTTLLARDVLPRPDTLGYLAASWPVAATTTVVPIILSILMFRGELRGAVPRPSDSTSGSCEDTSGPGETSAVNPPDNEVTTAHTRARRLVGTVVVVMSLALLVAEPAPVAALAAALCWGIVAWLLPEKRTAIQLPFASLGITTALFCAVAILHGLHALDPLTDLADHASAWQLGLLGGLGANVANNLPAYLALEPAAHRAPVRLLALLVGVNVTSGLTWWGSVATLLWRDRLRRDGVNVTAREHLWRTGSITVVTAAAALAVLILTG